MLDGEDKEDAMSDQHDVLEVDTTEWDEDDPRPWRKHAQTLENELKSLREELQTTSAIANRSLRRDAFEEAQREAKVEGLDLADLEDVPLEQINPTTLKVKLQEKAEARQAVLAEQAKAAGFESVEEFAAALAAVQEQRERQRTSLASQGAVAASASPPAPSNGPTPEEAAAEAYGAAKKGGKTDEQARTDAVMAKQARMAELASADSR